MRTNAKLPKALGKRIQKKRKLVKLTQEALAEKVHLSRAYVGYVEQGRNTPSLEVLQKIARALGTTMSELLKLPG